MMTKRLQLKMGRDKIEDMREWLTITIDKAMQLTALLGAWGFSIDEAETVARLIREAQEALPSIQ